MAMMAKMRSLAPAFILSVGVLFVLFMVISDSNVLEALGARSNNVGSVNGKDISYQEFSNFLDRAIENQKAQTGQEIPEENMDQFRDQVWDAIVTQTLTEYQIKKFGIKVTDEEVRDYILGPNPPEFLKKNFIDSTGKFNREMYESALFDARNKKALVEAEEVVRQQLLSQKLQSYLLATVSVGDAELKQKFIDQNIKMQAEFVSVDLNSFPDADFKTPEDEVKKYYNEHPDQFTVRAERKLKFVFFKIQPSRNDSDGILKNLQNVMLKAKNDTASFKYFCDIYSEVPYSKDTMDITQLPTALLDNFDDSRIGTMIGPFSANNTYGIYQISGTVPSNEVLAKASHILIKSTGDDVKDLAEATRVYNEVMSGMDFSTAAAKYSSDLGNAKNGGELGWFGKGRMVKEFEEACFNGPMGVIQKPVKTNYGYHVIKVTGKTSKKYIVEKIINSIKPSATTRDDIYNQANDFAYVAEKNGFEKEAELSKYKIEETPAFNEESSYLPTIGVNKSLLKFAFENGLNTLSQVFKGNNGYVVAKVSEVINQGVRKFEDVQKQAQALLLKDKKYNKAKSITEEIKKKSGGNFAAVKSIYSKANFDTTGFFTLSGSIPKLGLEYNFAAKAYDLPVGAVSAPIKGSRGYFLAKLLSKDTFDVNAFNTQKNSSRERILQEKKNSFISQWLAKMKKDADIVDKRYLFYSR
ncbi:MAG: hypothetical protein COZ80_05080 [Ignavibacteria bacterium CG_4_8_14_3_um_filter_37_9]|nr:hypothetical protein [Ignavibacteria bacterium]OIO18644.1 MAG: hypothetical protein AUJ54_07540 [Ignavibacteria bacterium CG1_02_37_35]PIP79526.1 MAG: hypothetical protein COW85_00775 [Ignavibacteria bacterium CG22_combo_CG10-13_8_21_14_all_37_15]PIS45745.1 MAG: hypothetical protein COT22_03610 [Ignavibacteria bacterium CG08_land_8_20_14_0_20_37_9]PIW99497.1 MAG: hypothetical protein COZ80_05080 [Ignavibacteria bacterium CG_4_8_14_3_um_filter_37_9]PIX94184.1 MAG: hypothetical protein COZ25_